MEKGDKTRKSVTETVAWSICKVVEDSLKWHDHEIPTEPVQRVEFQQDARNYSDCLEGTLVDHLQHGRHWLLASIDVKARKMHLYDCSQKYGSKWRGQIHSIL